MLKPKQKNIEAIVEDLSDRFVALSQQENFYRCDDYLKSRNDSSYTSKLTNQIDERNRFIMAKWSYQVLDYCNASKEIASIAISYVDKFLCSKRGSFVLSDKNYFQLAVMCSLHLAIKMHEPSKLENDTLSKLSKGLFSIKDICFMEREILSALSWRLCPATPCVFLDFFLQLLPSSISKTTKISLMKISLQQIHVATPYYCFCLEKPSRVAFSSLLNAMGEVRCTSEDVKALNSYADKVGFCYPDDKSLDLRRKLYSLLNPGSSSKLNKSRTFIHSSNNCAQIQQVSFCSQ